MRNRLGRLRRTFLADGPGTTALALLGLALFAAFYAWRLTAFLINDDEGSYLYAAWRMSLGELPYRDFLTPQLPGFLFPGAWLMRLTGPEVWPLRALAAAATLLAGVFTWRAARRLFGPATAAAAAGLLLLQPLNYLFGRTFRADPFMLLWTTAGTYAFCLAYPGLRRGRPGEGGEEADYAGRLSHLALAGLCFGLAILCKLFGVLPLAGCLLWLLLGIRGGRPWRRVLLECLVLGLAASLLVGVVMAYFATLSPQVEEAVLGHHLMQKSAGTRWGAFVKSLWFYFEFVDMDQGGLLLAVALATGLAAWTGRDRRLLLFGCQLATMAGFLLLSRDLFTRHLMVLLPALLTLAAAWLLALRREALAFAASREAAGPAASASGLAALARFPLLAALVVVLPWLSRDVSEGGRQEVATAKLADVIRLSTGPDDLVFSDFSELNFYSRRPTTYAAASMSAGAAKSGQISWKRVAQELGDRRPALLVEVDTATDPGHLVHMLDYGDFAAWRDAQYQTLGRFHRDFQTYTLYAPKERPPVALGQFAGGPKLLGAEPLAAQARGPGDTAPMAWATAGDTVQVATAWQGPPQPDAEYVATVRLVDLAGQEWAQSDTSLFADDPDDDRKSFAWEPNELVGQRIPLALPPDLPPGRYRVEVGMYIRNAEALPLLDAAGNPTAGRALAGEIAVRGGRLRGLPEGADVAERYEGLALSLPEGGRLELLGRGPLPADPVPAGTSLPLDLWWRIDGASPSGLASRISVPPEEALDPGQPLLAPGEGAEAQAAGGPLVLRQKIRVQVWRNTAAGNADLRLAVVGADGRELGTWSGLGVQDGRPLIATVAVGPPAKALAQWQAEEEQSAKGLTEAMRLPPPETAGEDDAPFLGSLLVPMAAFVDKTVVAPGQTLGIVLTALSSASSPIPYWQTVQLLDADGRPVSQQDGPVGGWDLPSDRWTVGQAIDTRHDLTLPADLQPGTYTLVAAVYNPQSGWRLPVRGPGAMGDMLRLGPGAMGDMLRLGEVQVAAGAAGDAAP